MRKFVNEYRSKNFLNGDKELVVKTTWVQLHKKMTKKFNIKTLMKSSKQKQKGFCYCLTKHLMNTTKKIKTGKS